MCKRTNLKKLVVISAFLLGMSCATAAGRTIYVDDEARFCFVLSFLPGKTCLGLSVEMNTT